MTRGAALIVHRRRTTCAFTLVELLVVISIVALLVALLLPALGKAKDAAKATVCKSRMASLAVAIEVYRNEYQAWYPTAGCEYPDGRTSYFAPLVMPYLGLQVHTTDRKLSPAENFMLCPASPYTPPVTGMSSSQARAHIRKTAYLLTFDDAPALCAGNYNMSVHFGFRELATAEARYQPRKAVATPPARTIMVGEVFDLGRLGYPLNSVDDVAYYHNSDYTDVLFVDGHVAHYAFPLSDKLGEIVFY